MSQPFDVPQTITIHIDQRADEKCIERMKRETALYIDWNGDIMATNSYPVPQWIVPLKTLRHRDTAERIVNSYKQCLELPRLEDLSAKRIKCRHVDPDQVVEDRPQHIVVVIERPHKHRQQSHCSI
jgi:hypothetical protein